MKNSITDFVSYEYSYEEKARELTLNIIDKNGLDQEDSLVKETVVYLTNLFQSWENHERIMRDEALSCIINSHYAFKDYNGNPHRKLVKELHNKAQELLEFQLHDLYQLGLERVSTIEQQLKNQIRALTIGIYRT